MKALLLRSGDLRVDEVDDPTPESGQVVVRSLACAICASDLHMVHNGRRLAEWSRDHDGPFSFDPDTDVVLGHEFCAEIVDHGPDTLHTHPVGSRVVSPPTVFDATGFDVIGYSNRYPGGFAQYMVLNESQLLAVPEHTPTDTAALMEPLSVGVQYARIANVQPGEVPLVIGCGAIGLAVIAALKLSGVAPVIAADFSALRRDTAVTTGADVVVDPADEAAFAAWQRHAGRGARAVAFECVGAPGVLNSLFLDAPWQTRIVVAGQCLDNDVLFTAAAHTKGVNVQFGGLPVPQDYSDSLAAIAAGDVDVDCWRTGETSLDGSIEAFTQTADAGRHTRIVVHPNG